MVVNVDLAEQIKQNFNDVVTIFISPPSVEEFQKRLVALGCDTAEEIECELEKAKSDIEKSSDYDYVVVNKNMYGAVIEVMDIILKNIQ